MINTNELSMIQLVRENDDSAALQSLMKKYRPIVDNFYKIYWIEGYDRNDWYQEAYIVCHQTCKIYDGDHGSKFANFFKMRFNNHIVSIIRAQRAIKRRANSETQSFESIMEKNENMFEFLTRPAPKMLDIVTHVETIISELSDLELIAFRVILGETTVEDACLRQQCDIGKLLRASSRCKNKIRRQLTQK
ncbi:sigma-70 family RNA polymerase sigma factor [Companilactobacillus mishanensis]|uniref:Sigma-70 family RNA polymerase sigma factor n=2 Tax=Companilactobacillus mishanensis TaxID=2486008 RepID=A0A5P0ZIV0_9LACO|nr:sigma-70 family RNA polymerase sigma factor [Companilactobacillus mishanensis]MQS44841.1 sigma-70 family RNA polymerase sigma factor [Companilactobacillus mishanensis]MQS52962.1 sigma-70 family RNA polymerase sigma factor [Companilactobacillus mishanensis]